MMTVLMTGQLIFPMIFKILEWSFCAASKSAISAFLAVKGREYRDERPDSLGSENGLGLTAWTGPKNVKGLGVLHEMVK